MTPRNNLIALIKEQKEDVNSKTKPVVTLEEFFESNNDYASIGCNLDMPYEETASKPEGLAAKIRGLLRQQPATFMPPTTAPHPGPSGFYRILKAVWEREDVQDVLVEIDELEGLDWPFSEVVYVLTSASLQDVEGWVKDLFPDEVAEGYFGNKPSRAPELLPGYQVYSVWWD